MDRELIRRLREEAHKVVANSQSPMELREAFLDMEIACLKIEVILRNQESPTIAEIQQKLNAAKQELKELVGA